VVRTPRKRILAAVAAFGAVAAVAVGCDSIDPTAQSFGITFWNDTGRSVHLKLCANGSCTHFNYSDHWKAGQRAEENISDRDVFTRWLVQDDMTGKTLGCLPLEFDQKYTEVEVRVSQMVPCPGSEPLVVQKGNGLGQS
jgi:hypothetical protein